MSAPAFPCRACGSLRTEEILSLGSTPLANALVAQADLAKPEETFPLDLVLCRDCSLLQITETVPPEKLFSHYLYFSSFSDTMVRHADTLATRLIAEEKLGAGSLAGEIASNDGYLLQHYKRQGVPVLGVEPAENVAKVAIEERGVDTLCAFFGKEVGEKLAAEGKRADVIHGNNVLAHVADLNGVVAGLSAWVKDTGIVVIEAPYLKDFLDHVEFDTVYHEHLCYFSFTTLAALFEKHGLFLHDVERIAIHGGSIRIFGSRVGTRPRTERAAALLAEEAAWGVKDRPAYDRFAENVITLKRELRALIADLRSQGKTVAAYGASAKGATLLNYCGIDHTQLDFAADRSTYKQGRHMPGVHVRIVAPEMLLEKQPDYTLLLTWNFAEEILKQQQDYRDRGGKFIVPVPLPKIV